MEMPLSEMLDRLSIALLKQLRTEHDMTLEIVTYLKAIKQHGDYAEMFVDLLYANTQMWNSEAGLRAIDAEEMGLEEMGRRSLVVRDWNKKRVVIKNKIVDASGEGFKDIKVNHASE